jgi:hypothetical protein
MKHDSFAFYVAKLSGLRNQEVQLRYAVCLYDLDLFNPGRKVLPLGYVTEANLVDGTTLSCTIRRDIPEDALFGLGRFAKQLFLNGNYVKSVTASLEQYAKEAEMRGVTSVLDVAAVRTTVTSLCVRSVLPIPQSVRDIAGFTDRTTSEEYESIGFAINQKLINIPFISRGITSENRNTFMFPVD